MSKSYLNSSHIARLFGLMSMVLGLCGFSYANTGDSIPPTIIVVSQDVMIDCELAIEDSLQNWFDRFGGLQAEDDISEVTYQSDISASEALARLDLNRDISCGMTGSVSVGFFALDTCSNSSDTSFAIFEVIDTSGPIFTTLPRDLSIQCDPTRSDSLNAWIQTFGGATIKDNCDLTVSFDSYTYTLGDGQELNGSFNEDLDITPDQCDFTVSVTFIAMDDCGNISEASASFILMDTIAPEFLEMLDDTVRVNCDNIPSARSVNVSDDCNGTLAPVISDITTQDPDPNTCEHFNYIVNRTYTATDLCGNSTAIEQVIFVTDTLEPRFVAPPDTTISNTTDADPSITGFPIDIIDNCSSEVIIDYTDNQTISECSISIDRRWNIQDLCGSSLVLSQHIIIVDSIAPIVVRPPIDIIVSCTNAIDLASGFEEWVSDRGSAVVRDEIGEIVQTFAAVPGSYDIKDASTWPGEAPDSFDEPQCPSSQIGLTQFEIVDFVFVDNCGNALAVQGTFGISDDINPVILTEIQDTQLFINNQDNCTASFTLNPVLASDNCLDENPNSFNTGNVSITAPTNEVPVDPVTLNFGPFEGNIAENGSPVQLTIRLLNVDANNPTEYFDIISESGTILGRTNNTAAQCGDGTTVLSISRQEILAGLSEGDDFFSITLTPNIVAGVPTLSINTVCSNSLANGILDIGSRANFDITYSIKVNDEQAQVVTSPQEISLVSGAHRITYIATDCAGNQDSVVQNLTVSDTITNIELICPDDFTEVASFGNCSADILFDVNSLNNGCSEVLTVDSILIAGATQQTIVSPRNQELITLSVGSNQVSYHYSNGSVCDQRVIIRDQEFPQILCGTDIPVVFHPSGVIPVTLDTSAILTSISDNCDLGNITIDTPNISCADIGSSVNITVRVSDAAGNITICNSNLRITEFELIPDVEPILCIGDTIRLSSNAPTDNGSESLQFRWTGPEGFNSTEREPIIANSTLASAGRYSLELIGENGCSVSGSVDLIIQDFTSPNITAATSSACLGDSVILSTTAFTSEVIYSWYEGTFPDGQLLQSDESAELQLAPTVGVHEYYLIIESNSCDISFDPSDPISIEIVERPVFSVSTDTISLCFGDTLNLLGTSENDSLNFRWTGPSEFIADSIIGIIPNASEEQSGSYILSANVLNCVDSMSIEVIVQDSLSTPVISGPNQYCNDSEGRLIVTNYMNDNGLSFNWFVDNTLFAVTDSAFIDLISIDSSLTGVWSVIADDGLCSSDRSDPFEVSIIDNLNITIDANNPVCENDSIRFSIPGVSGATYSWSGPGGFSSDLQNPIAPSIGGTYSVNISTESGCSTIASTTVRVEPIPRILTVFADTEDCTDGTNQTILFSSVFPDDNVSYNWTGPNGYSSTEARPRLVNYTSEDNGIYRLIVTRGSCISSEDSVIIDVKDIPDVPVLGDDISACSGDSIRLSIVSQDSISSAYIWTTPQGLITTPNPFLTLPIITEEDAGQYYVIGSNSGCESVNSDTLDVSVFMRPEPPIISNNTPVCAGEDLTLSITRQNNTSYEWVGPDNFTSDDVSITINSSNIDAIQSYGVRIVLNGCPSEYVFADNVTIDTQPPAPQVTTEDIELCADDNISVELCIDRSNIAAGTTVEWINTSSDMLIGTSNEECFLLNTTSPLLPGVNNIVAQVSADGCPSELSNPVLIDLFAIPDVTARAGDDIIVCDANDILISAVEPLRGIGTWTSEDPDITFSEPNNHITRVFGLRRGDNRLQWTLSNGPCEDFSTDEKVVTFEEDVIAVDDELSVSMNSSSILNLVENDDMVPSQYEIAITDQPFSGTITIDMSQEVTFTVENQFIGEVSFTYELCSTSCIDNCAQAAVSVIVGDLNQCTAPTIITPNSDGVNDEFVIPCINTGNFDNNEFIVYNEWGDEVYYAQPYDNTWQGTYNGNKLPSGTYFYVFKPNELQEATKGFLIIQR